MWFGKRLFDLMLSIFGLIILSPLFIFIALIIKSDSRGPVFFRQIRVGKNGQHFRIHKFRTMTFDPDITNRQLTIGIDPRITRTGQFLRKYKLDEFAQLIDVVLGSMSIVGPRPEVPRYVETYSEQQKQIIFSVRPGITDWASVTYRNESELLGKQIDPEKYYLQVVLPKKLMLAQLYIENSSLLVDIKIILKTLNLIF